MLADDMNSKKLELFFADGMYPMMKIFKSTSDLKNKQVNKNWIENVQLWELYSSNWVFLLKNNIVTKNCKGTNWK